MYMLDLPYSGQPATTLESPCLISSSFIALPCSSGGVLLLGELVDPLSLLPLPCRKGTQLPCPTPRLGSLTVKE